MSESEHCAQPVAHGPPNPPTPTRDSRVGFLVRAALDRAEQVLQKGGAYGALGGFKGPGIAFWML